MEDTNFDYIVVGAGSAEARSQAGWPRPARGYSSWRPAAATAVPTS